MENKGKNRRTYRFTPAYILLFLSAQNLYGSAIRNMFHDKLPLYNVDSAVIYRSLQELEKEGALRSHWETENPGPATKWYEITEIGRKKLAHYKEEIEIRKQNLDFFLETYRQL